MRTYSKHLLDDIPPIEPDILSFIIHDFLYRKKSVSGTASEIYSKLKKSIQNRILSVTGSIMICFSTMMKFVLLELITEKPRATVSAVFLSATTLTGTAVAAKLCIRKMIVPADPKVGSNAFNSLNKENIPDKSREDNNVHAVHDKLIRGNSLIAMAADITKNNLEKQGITVPKFNTACEPI